MFPIRCVVECVNESECVKCSDRGAIIADSFAIVAGQTPLSQLVETVLSALGLQHLAFGAKGWIQVKNWKPLGFDQITDDPDIEIESVLKDVSNQMTLRILTKQSDAAVADCIRDMKDRLLKVALQKVPKLLQDASAFQPHLKDLIIQLTQGDAAASIIDAQQMHQFNVWLEEFASNGGRGQVSSGNSNGLLSQLSTNSHRNGQYSSTNAGSSSNNQPRYGASSNTNTPNHLTPGATRFSALLEVPKLERWFRENPNPSRQKLQYYMQILNGSNFRKHAGKITYQQICNWFSNARAAQRKKTGHVSSPETVARVQQASTNQDGRPSSSGSGIGGAGTAANHWVNKVFSNNVRNLSIAFNDFIQSAPASSKSAKPNATNEGGVVAVNVASSQSPPTPLSNLSNTNQSQNNLRVTSPSLDESSSSSPSPIPRPVVGPASGEISINVTRDEEEGQMTFKEEEIDEDGDARMGIIIDSANEEGASSYGSVVGLNISPSVSPLSLGATLKAINDGLPTMALPNRLSNASASAALAAAASASAAVANRTRLMFDPLTELPMLERWFEENPHPSWAQVDQYTEQLNGSSYRQTYPPVSSHNLKIWFKNRRAKCKRLMNGGGSADGSISAITVKGEHN